MKGCDVRLWLVIAIALACVLSSSPARAGETPNSSARRPVIYVMPNAVANPGSGDNSQVIVDSSHNGKEPQIAKFIRSCSGAKNVSLFLKT
jgi:hypothetical protein